MPRHFSRPHGARHFRRRMRQRSVRSGFWRSFFWQLRVRCVYCWRPEDLGWE